MPYDNTCKFLAETFPADSVIFLESTKIILHIEFQTETDKNMPFRMADYRLRLYRKFSKKPVYQVVIYLNRTDSPLVFETEFNLGELVHKFNVIRLWEQAPEILQQYQGLLPFAPLAQTNNPEEVLRDVAKQIDDIEDKNLKSNLTTAAYIFSGLVLDKEIIQRILRSEIMKESVTFQEILLQGELKGKAEGLIEGEVKGMTKERTQIALNMLHSGISLDLIAQFTGLTIEQIQKLQ